MNKLLTGKKFILCVSVLTLAACSSDGSSSRGPTVTQIDTTPVVTPPDAPQYPASSQLMLKVVDANNGAPVEGVKVQLDGAIVDSTIQPGTTDANGEIPITLNQSAFEDANKDGYPDTPKLVSLRLSSDAILATSKTAAINTYGNSNYTIKVVKLDNAPEGVQVEEIGLAAVKRSLNTMGKPVKTFETTSEADPKTKVEVPDNIRLISAEGKEIALAELKVQVVAFDTTGGDSAIASELKPGNRVAKVKNPAKLANKMSVTPEKAAKATIRSIGLVAVKLGDNTNTAKSIVSEDPVKISIPVTAGTVGDEIHVWSMSEGDDAWSYEGVTTIYTNTEGGLSADVDVRHFSYFNLGYVDFNDTCSSTIRVQDINGSKSPIKGTFHLSNSSMSQTDYYSGDGVLTLIDVPAEPVNISFTPQNLAAGLVHARTTVSLAQNGALSKEGSAPVIENADVCDSDGARITFQTLEKPTPTVSMTFADESGPRAYSIDMAEGKHIAVKLQLHNAPSDKSKTFPVVVTVSGAGAVPASSADFSVRNADTIQLSGTNLEHTFYVDALADNLPEPFLEAYQLTVTSSDALLTANNVPASKSITRYGVIRDMDRVAITNVTASGSEESGKAEVVLEFSHSVDPAKLYGIAVRPVSGPKNGPDHRAVAGLDFASPGYYANGAFIANSLYPTMVEGSDNKKAVVTIPLLEEENYSLHTIFDAHLSVSPSVFSLDEAKKAIKVDVSDTPAWNQSIVDREVVPASYTITGLSADGKPNLDSTMNKLSEGQVRFMRIQLDKPSSLHGPGVTRPTINVSLDEPGVARNGQPYYRMSLDGGETFVTEGKITVEAKQSTHSIMLVAPDNWDNTGDIDFKIKFSSDNGSGVSLVGPTEHTITIVDNDTDYVVLASGFSISQGLEADLAAMGYNNTLNYWVYSSIKDLQITANASVEESNDPSVAKIGKDYSANGVPGTLDLSKSRSIEVQVNDNNKPEPSKKITVTTELVSIKGNDSWVLATMGDNYGCYQYNTSAMVTSFPGCTIESTQIIGNDDTTQFSLLLAPKLTLKAENANDFKAQTIDLTLESNGIPEGFMGEVVFDVKLGADVHGTAKLSAKTPKTTVSINLPAVTQKQLIKQGVLTGVLTQGKETGTAQYQVSLSVSEGSKTALKAANADWVFPAKQVDVHVSYTVYAVRTPTPPTGATGGVSGGE